MHELPPYGTAPIRCGRTRCKWRGYEDDLEEVHGGSLSISACPICGYDSTSNMTPEEIKAWERAQRSAAQKGQ